MSTPRPPHPPAPARRLLRHRLAPDRRAEVLDDLDDLYRLRLQRRGRPRAALRYWYDALSICLRPALCRRRTAEPSTYEQARGPLMLKNYLKVAFRNFSKHKAFSTINVAGLAAGLAACLLILLYLQDERSYDRHHAHADRVYRLIDDVSIEGEVRHFAAVSAPMGPALVRDYPEVERAVRFNVWEEPDVRHGDRHFDAGNVFFADSTAFEVFTFPLLVGDPATALREPYSLVVTEAAAARFFGDEAAPGQVLTIGGDDYRVTGVMRDVPRQSHFHFELLASFNTLEDNSRETVESWWRHDFYTYLLLRTPEDAPGLSAKLPGFIDRHMGALLAEDNAGLAASLQPLTQIHLYSSRYEEIEPNGSVAMLYFLAAVGLFILLIACFNFVNLSTARSAGRAREVGLRKVLGAGRGQLMGQFIGESVAACLVALGLALALVVVLLPVVNDLAGKDLTLRLISQRTAGLAFIGFALAVGLLAGLYPALVLSTFRPVDTLKGTAGSRRTAALRKGLVVVQFALSLALIAGTGVVLRQLHYVKHKNLGFDKEQVAVLPMNAALRAGYEGFKDEISRHPHVLAVSRSSGVPGLDAGIGGWPVRPEGFDADWPTQMIWVDYGFTEAYGMELVAGRSFSTDLPTDSAQAFLLNETAVKGLGWGSPEDALDKRINWDDRKDGVVIGVVRDFHVKSLHASIDPLVIHIWPRWSNYVAVRIRPGHTAEALDFIRARWDARAPGEPFEPFFLDARFDAMYAAEERFGRLFGTFALLAVLIAGLGLFGLASFTVEQRTKEIGIRKVMGASAPRIALMLSASYTRLVLAACVPAVPLVYVAMDRWLSGFAYRVDVGPGVFVLAALGVLAVAWLAVGYQSVRAALTDPVKALRYE